MAIEDWGAGILFAKSGLCANRPSQENTWFLENSELLKNYMRKWMVEVRLETWQRQNPDRCDGGHLPKFDNKAKILLCRYEIRKHWSCSFRDIINQSKLKYHFWIQFGKYVVELEKFQWVSDQKGCLKIFNQKLFSWI